jgi:hypothetical protein
MPAPRFCALEMGSLWVYQILTRWFPLNVPGFHLNTPRGVTLQGYTSSHLGRACTAPLVAANQARTCARLPLLAGVHLALCLASTVHGFGASTSPIPTVKASWGNQALQECSPPTLPLLFPILSKRGQAASSVRNAVPHCVAQAPLLRQAQFAFKGVRWRQHNGQGGK